jgi:3-vinyl bacteriochlorophyllide hydratase
VQGVLAPVQFFAFLVSAVLVIRFLLSGSGLEIANISVVTKTLLLYTIMITGCIWEKEVFGVYLFAPAFYWEDVFSMLVLALHTAYLIALAANALSAVGLMWLALAAYSAYAINATQFLLKLRRARLQSAVSGTASRRDSAGGLAA